MFIRVYLWLNNYEMHENFAKVIKPKSAEAELLAQIDPARLPEHIAVIMDGNGRWAKARGKPRIFGHREGAESVRSILDTCTRLQIKAVTLYAFSTENWKRPEDEVSGLMQMLKLYLKKELKTVHKNNIRFQAIGKIEGLSADLQKQLGFGDGIYGKKYGNDFERRAQLRRTRRDHGSREKSREKDFGKRTINRRFKRRRY